MFHVVLRPVETRIQRFLIPLVVVAFVGGCDLPTLLNGEGGDPERSVDSGLPENETALTDVLVLSASGDDLTRVEFTIDGEVVREDAEEPFEWTLDPVSLTPGTDEVSIRAWRDSGEAAHGTAEVGVPESVVFNLPEDGRTIAWATGLSVTGEGIDRVEFHLAGELVYEDAEAPFEHLLDPSEFANGSLAIAVHVFVEDGSEEQVSLTVGVANPEPADLDRVGKLWSPYLEWSLENPTWTGNPFDLIATATFTHISSGDQITTGMFYDSGNTWKFRFAGTRTGTWAFVTSSDDPDLTGRTGTVAIGENPGVNGFITQSGNKWMFQGTNKAFVPQFVMYAGPHYYYQDPDRIDADITLFMDEHGFTGFHVPVFCRWFDMNEDRSRSIETPNPDPRTFEALELLLEKVHAKGGSVHFWAWGDEARRMTPIPWGINGTEDQRLQRYIAARLGPVVGWTMGYGFDLHEWVSKGELETWHSYMQEHLGWKHYLGARGKKNSLRLIYDGLDYSAYEQHRPDYDKYVELLEARPTKPSFAEDRFRMDQGHPYKDYTMEMTRRGLWHSTMAGGVANIWGNFDGRYEDRNNGVVPTVAYPNPETIKTYSLFFENRFHEDMVRSNDLTDGFCLRRGRSWHVFYKESTSSIRLDLSGMTGSQPAVAVDTKKAYSEISLGALQPEDQTWSAPYESDWAIAVGSFQE